MDAMARPDVVVHRPVYVCESSCEDEARYNSWTALHDAAQSTSTSAVASLLEQGADVHAQSSGNRCTALHVAAFNGRMSIVALLVLNRADVHAEDEDGYTPLYDAQYASAGTCACVADTPERQPGRVAAFLAQAMALSEGEREQLALRSWERSFAQSLDEAISSGCRVTLARLLASHRRHIDARDYDGWSALHSAAHKGDLLGVRLLLAAGVHICGVTNLGESALHLAAREGHVSVARLLLANSADAHATARSGMTPLAAARRSLSWSDNATSELVEMLERADLDDHCSPAAPADSVGVAAGEGAAAAAARLLPLARAATQHKERLQAHDSVWSDTSLAQ